MSDAYRAPWTVIQFEGFLAFRNVDGIFAEMEGDSGEDRATAALIAAAPSLLAALEAILTHCIDYSSLVPGDLLTDAIRALAKARGEVQS